MPNRVWLFLAVGGALSDRTVGLIGINTCLVIMQLFELLVALSDLLKVAHPFSIALYLLAICSIASMPVMCYHLKALSAGALILYSLS